MIPREKNTSNNNMVLISAANNNTIAITNLHSDFSILTKYASSVLDKKCKETDLFRLKNANIHQQMHQSQSLASATPSTALSKYSLKISSPLKSIKKTNPIVFESSFQCVIESITIRLCKKN